MKFNQYTSEDFIKESQVSHSTFWIYVKLLRELKVNIKESEL